MAGTHGQAWRNVMSTQYAASTGAASKGGVNAKGLNAEGLNAEGLNPGGLDAGRRRPAPLEALGLVVGLTLAVAVLFVAFALPGARTAPRDVPVGVVGPAPAVAQVRQGLAQAQPGAFAVTTYPDDAALRQSVRNREVYGGFVLGRAAPTVLVATGGGPVVAQALEGIGQQLAGRTAAQPPMEDLAPLPSSDPRGLALAGAALPISIGGLVPALLLVRRFPRRPGLRVASAVAFSLLTGVTLAAILQWWFGSTSTDYWRVALGLSLGLGAISLVILGLESMFGLVGFGVGAALNIIVGNPLSGLTSAPQFLPSGWGALGQLLPPGANATLLRSDAYFEGAGGGRPVLVLSCWVVLGLVLVGVAAVRQRRARA
jgi:hypothetical protein